MIAATGDCWLGGGLDGFGVDRLVLVGPASEALAGAVACRQRDLRVASAGEVLAGGPWSGGAPFGVGRGSAAVGIERGWGGPLVVIGVSLPSFLDGHEVDPVPVDAAHRVCGEVLDALKAQLPDIPDLDQCMLRRLDLVRDWRDIPELDARLRQFASFDVEEGIRAGTEDADGRVHPVVRAADGWVLSAFDLGAELASRSPWGGEPGQAAHRAGVDASDVLRVQIQLGPEQLAMSGIRLCALDEALLFDLGKWCFERCGMDSLTGSGGSLDPGLAAPDDGGAGCFTHCQVWRLMTGERSWPDAARDPGRALFEVNAIERGPAALDVAAVLAAPMQLDWDSADVVYYVHREQSH